MGRWDKIEKAARKRGFVADDEVVRACGLSMGTSVLKPDGTHDKDMQRHALIVTDRNVHAIRMGQAGFRSLKEPLFSLPRDELGFSRDGTSVAFHKSDHSQTWSFAGSAFGNGFDDLAEAMADQTLPGP
jgi:hypothetical protein